MRTPKKIVEMLRAEIPAKISRNKFCLKTGINQNSIDKYMAGITVPTLDSIHKLAVYFDVTFVIEISPSSVSSVSLSPRDNNGQ